MHPLLGFCQAGMISVFRLAYKPHSVRRLIPVYAIKLRPGAYACAIISLSSLPGTQMKRAASCPCLALLPAGVTWPPALLRTPVVSYTTFSPLPSPPTALPEGEGGGGKAVFFCGPDPAGCPVPGFPRRRALWSADFPRPFAVALGKPVAKAQGRDRPASLKTKV